MDEIAASIVSIALICALPSALAQGSYPDKSVRMVVPYPPGGASDVLARIVDRKLGEQSGQQFVVDNRLRAGTVIGTQIVASAIADGYTLLLTSTPMGTKPALYAKLPYDTARDFRGVAFVAFAPVVMVAHPAVPAKTPQELIAAAKSRSVAFSVATPGPGSMGI